MPCAICETRRERRYCPGVRGEICTICCGTEREVSVKCPLDCEYLQDARIHEKLVEDPTEQVPNLDIDVSERFVQEHNDLISFLGGIITLTALREQDAPVDYDVREALAGLVSTYRTLQSGVYYESIPNNPFAAAIYRQVQDALQEARLKETEEYGMTKTRDADVLGALVFLQRIEYDRNNGRKLGRAFVDFLREIYTEEAPAEEEPPASLILP